MEQKKKVTLSDIAKKLNVSTVTVSKAVSDKEGVGEDLRKQIKQLAEEMGYKTKSQTTEKTITGNIGIVIPSRFFSQSYSFYWYLFNYLSSELLNRNYYCIMELLTDEDEKNCNIPRMILDKKIDGIILLGQTSTNYIEKLNSNFENFILLDFYTNDTNIDSVINDNYHNSYLLTNYVISQGHKKLQFVGDITATTSIKDRYMGFLKALIENNIDYSNISIISDRDKNGSSIPIELPLDNMPTAFICNNDETAAMVINELEKNGFKVPDNISVTGFDNYISRNKSPVEITTVYIKPENIASVAADLILKKINGTPYVKGRHLVSGEILIKNSVKIINL